MDKAAFTDTEADPKWWLLQLDVAFELTEPRKDVGENVGWGREDQWYLEKWKLEQLYDLIEQRSFLLLQELDDATEDYKRQEWLTKVVELTKPAADSPSVKPVESSAESTATATASAESAAQAAESSAAPSSAGAAPKPSIFKKKPQPAPEAPPAGSEAPVPTAAADGATIEAAVKDVMAHIEEGNLPALASELGISEQELAELVRDLPENFESLVAAEVAKLAEAGRSAQ